MDKLTPEQENYIGDLQHHEKKITEDIDTMICGLCKFYDSDMCYCEKHLDWGELVEKDTCSDYKECD